MISHAGLGGFKTVPARPTVTGSGGPMSLDLTNLNVLIGHHGAGKSNFLSFFEMMSHAMLTPGALGAFVTQQGGAHNLVQDPNDSPREIRVDLTLRTQNGEAMYSARLHGTVRDTLMFVEEKYLLPPTGPGGSFPHWTQAGNGHEESLLPRELQDNVTPNPIRDILANTKTYQLETQGQGAPIRSRYPLTDDRKLRENGANLAPFLIRLRNKYSWHYQRIVNNLRLLLPFFSDFTISRTPQEDSQVLLYWREKDTERTISPAQTSDSTLRVMALVTLLLQPRELMPDVIILDEPCLGLHPDITRLIGGMVQAQSLEAQVLLATQSPALMDCFEPQDILVVERESAASTVRRLDPEEMGTWLDEYSISELWEKNVLSTMNR